MLIPVRWNELFGGNLRRDHSPFIVFLILPSTQCHFRLKAKPPNAGHHPPARTIEVESRAVAGRVHAVIGIRGSFLSSDSVESMAEERTCRVGVTNLHAVA
jgi:hypothetical protein